MIVDDAAAFPSSNPQTDAVELIDVENDSKAPIPPQNPGAKTPPAVYPGGFSIDVCFEASKLPLDVAIFNSARAAGGDDKIRKYLQAVLVIGGTAHIPGMGHALESRSASAPLIGLAHSSMLHTSLLKATGHCNAPSTKYGESSNDSSTKGSRPSRFSMERSCSTRENGQCV